MPKNNHAHPVILSELASFSPDNDLRVVIETPKGSPNKYSYNPDCDCFELKTVMPAGMTFPYDFGFVPSTLAEDGDPLDVLVLMEFPVVARCILNARPIGVIEAEQEENGEKFRNDRLIAVSVHSRAHEDAHSLKNLRPRLVDEITSFFVDYNEIHGKKFLPLGVHGPHRAKDLIEAARKRFAKSRKGKKK